MVSRMEIVSLKTWTTGESLRFAASEAFSGILPPTKQEPEDKTTKRLRNYPDFFVAFRHRSFPAQRQEKCVHYQGTKVTKKNRTLTFVSFVTLW